MKVYMAIKIFIDQGHNPSGYFNSGAEANGLYESEINYEVGILLQTMLNSDGRFETMVSRPAPYTVLGYDTLSSLQARVNMANEWPADYFISIHCNSNPLPQINGTEVYIYQFNTQANWLANDVMSGITRTTGTRDNGIREAPGLYVLRQTNMTSILVELGYLTNASDALKLRYNLCQFAFGIYIGLIQYFGLL